MPYLDTCDRCLTEDSPAIAPISVAPSSPGGVLATYRCPNCGDRWQTGWAVQDDESAA